MGNEVVQARFTGFRGTPFILEFDGRHVEMFGGSGSNRWHIELLQIRRDEPDRKGRVKIAIENPGKLGEGEGSTMEFDPDEVPALDELLAAIDAAKQNL